MCCGRRRAGLEVPDFEWVCERFLAAKDAWREFYRVGHPDHYAGCGRRSTSAGAFCRRCSSATRMAPVNFIAALIPKEAARLGERARLQRDHGRSLFNKGGQALRARLNVLKGL